MSVRIRSARQVLQTCAHDEEPETRLMRAKAAEELLIIMQLEEIAPDVLCYNAAVSAMQHGRSWKDVLRIFRAGAEDAAASGCSPDKGSYEAMLKSCPSPQPSTVSTVYRKARSKAGERSA